MNMKENMKKFAPCDKTWSDILSEPSDIKVEQINTGDFYVKKNTMIKTDEVTDVKMPVYCYIIKHRSGNYLIDTGLDTSFQKRKYGSQRAFMGISKVCEGKQVAGQSISEYLEKNEIKIEDIFISHLHFDHTAGLIDLPYYNSCIMADTEPYNEEPHTHYGDYFKHIKEYKLISFKDTKEIAPLGKVIDYFDDNSLYVVLTDGHSKGHLSFLVNSKPNPIFIAGDAYIFESDELINKGPGIFTKDYDKGYDVIKNIIKFGEEHKNVKVLTGHGAPLR